MQDLHSFKKSQILHTLEKLASDQTTKIEHTVACKKTGDLVNLPYKPGISN